MVSVGVYSDHYHKEDWLKDHQLSAAFGLTATALIMYGLDGLVFLTRINKRNLEEVVDEFHYILNCQYFIYN